MAASILAFVRAVIGHGWSLASGPGVAVLTAAISFFTGAEVSPEVYVLIALAGIPIACFRAWKDEHDKHTPVPRRVRLSLAGQSEVFKGKVGMPPRPAFWQLVHIAAENVTMEAVPDLEVRIEDCREREGDQPYALDVRPVGIRESNSTPDASGAYQRSIVLPPLSKRRFDVARRPTAGEDSTACDLCLVIPTNAPPLPVTSLVRPKDRDRNAVGLMLDNFLVRRRYWLQITATGSNTLPAEVWVELSFEAESYKPTLRELSEVELAALPASQ